MKSGKPNHKRRKSSDIHDKYRRLLKRPDLTDQEVEKIRRNITLLAQTICEHVWGKKFY